MGLLGSFQRDLEENIYSNTIKMSNISSARMFRVVFEQIPKFRGLQFREVQAEKVDLIMTLIFR